MITPDEAERMLRKFLAFNFDSWMPAMTKTELLQLAWKNRPDAVRAAANDPREDPKIWTPRRILDLFFHTDGSCVVDGKVIAVDVTINESESFEKLRRIPGHWKMIREIGIEHLVVIHWTIESDEFDEADEHLYELFVDRINLMGSRSENIGRLRF